MHPKIGFIGIGAMGHGMAKNLLEKGYEVIAKANRNRERLDNLLSIGASEASSAKQLAQSCDVVIICVTGSPQVESIVYGENGLLAGVKDGQIVIDCSTGEAGVVEKIAADLKEKGCAMADAPLARTPIEAAAGKLNTMVGASDALFEKIKPVLECFCENIFHMGPVGSGSKMKLINNLITMGQAALIAEAMSACKATGVDLQRFRQVISAGGGNSGIFQMIVPAILDEGSFDGMKFSIANACKDLRYLNSMLSDAQITAPMAALVHNALLHAANNGFTDALVGALVADQAQANKVDIGKC
ncbi:MAG: beta-hydroxyacid dehydrogenase, 3-hydroxyisobutyrate dehydrogenase [Osedax symbiont Rs2]|nr:MAG: beta-hydroxyacid dehydrogenase, 3-hydroxyisobutyrate dehydrogenase [Osedax symbiont Rs2]